MTTPDPEALERALVALRWGSSEPLALKLGNAPAVVLHPADARPIRQAALRVLRALLREQERRRA